MSADVSLGGAHWEFALAVYGRPGVADACVQLQDAYGVDVNVLLVMLYANAMRGVKSAPDSVAALDAVAQPIRETAVVPLRAIRRAMKGRDFGDATERVRSKVKASELAAEQLEQMALAAVALQWPDAGATCDPQGVVLDVVRHFGGDGPVVANLVDPIVSAVHAVRT